MTIVADTTVEIPTRTLVFGMVGEDGTIRASELYPVAEACGQSGDQVRSCLRRLVGEGLFVRSGAGRVRRSVSTRRTTSSRRSFTSGSSSLGASSRGGLGLRGMVGPIQRAQVHG